MFLLKLANTLDVMRKMNAVSHPPHLSHPPHPKITPSASTQSAAPASLSPNQKTFSK